jgi:hypothetical protein
MFVGFLGDATATPHSTLTTTLFFIFASFGLAVFIVAMANPKWLPGRDAAEHEENEREVKQHKSELALEEKKANARTFRQFTNPFSADMGQRDHTHALNRLADEMRLHREFRESQSDGDDE